MILLTYLQVVFLLYVYVCMSGPKKPYIR